MKKGIIIIGTNGSGKTRKAHELTDIFGENVVWLDGKKLKLHPFIFSDCTEKTEAIVIDNVNKYKYLEQFIYLPNTRRGVEINKKHKAPFTIHPYFVLVCDEKIEFEKHLGYHSLLRRYDVFDCTPGVNRYLHQNKP